MYIRTQRALAVGVSAKIEFLTLYNTYLTETKSLPDTIVKLAQNYSVNISCMNERINHLQHDNCLN